MNVNIFLLRIFAFLSVWFFSFSFVARGEVVTLTKDGKSDYAIVLCMDASPSEKHVARELQMFLKMISGATIPIYRDNESISGPMILVGNGALLQEIDKTIDFNDLGREGFVIRTCGSHLVIAGGKLRGTMYGVYRFLKLLGCRWYSPEVSHIPRRSDIQLEPLNISEKPAFTMRNMDWRCGFDGDWAARNYRNGVAQLGVTRGGRDDYKGVHTYFRLVQPERYFENHPEYYSIVQGIRKWEYAQLCPTNPEVAKIAARSIIEWVGREPGGVVYNVGQEDWRNYCPCSRCSSINEREESYAGSNIYLVNAIAERVGNVYPDIKVGTLAYMGTEKPPKHMHTVDNVAIRLAIIERCHAHPLEVCPENAHIADNVRGWGEACDHIYLKDYANDFRHLQQPFPDWWALQEDLIFFKSRNVDGVLLQGNSFTETGAFSELQSYLQAQMLWNPYQNIFDVIDEFLSGYYGPATPAIRKFIDIIQTNVRNLNNHFDLFSPPTVSYLAPDIIRKAEQLFDDAEHSARGLPEFLHRVEESRLMLRYIKLNQPVAHFLDGNLFIPDWNTCAYDDIDTRELFNFMERCNDHEITSLDEWGKMFTRHEHMRVNVGTHSLVTLETELLAAKFLPAIGGCLYSLFDKEHTKEYLVNPQIEDSRASVTGGFSFGPSWNEIYYPEIVNEHDGNRLILRGFLSNNSHSRVHNSFSEKRDIFLPEGKKELHVTQTITAILSVGRPQTMSARGEFMLGSIKDIKIGIANGDGNYALLPLPAERDGRGRIGTEFRRREIQSGSLCVVNVRDNTGIMVSFDLPEIESCSVYVNPNRNSISLNISGNQITFRKGDEASITYKYIFLDDTEALF